MMHVVLAKTGFFFCFTPRRRSRINITSLWFSAWQANLTWMMAQMLCPLGKEKMQSILSFCQQNKGCCRPSRHAI
jgi:hypothetical protein